MDAASSPSKNARAGSALGPALTSVIEVVASGEEVSHKKPSPDLYRLAMARLGLTAHDCVALEDSEMGLRAARAAGLPAVVTVNDDTVGQDFSGASLVVSSLGEPGAPARVIRGEGGPQPWITLETLRRLSPA